MSFLVYKATKFIAVSSAPRIFSQFTLLSPSISITMPKRKLTMKDFATANKSPKKLTEKSNGDSASSTTVAKEFKSIAKSPNGKPWKLKFSSWNVNGIRAWLKHGGLEYLEKESPDIFAVQETKCSKDKIPEELKDMEGYYTYYCSSDRQGYAGVALFSREKPIQVKFGLGKKKHDVEGRVFTAEYPDFFLVGVYTPNSGRGLPRLDYRTKEWDRDFGEHLKNLDGKKPVVCCGDLNVAHHPIDLANPKSNLRSAGFTQEERDSFTALLDDCSLADSFRRLYPDRAGAYTFWSNMGGARGKNVGWRLDYFLLSDRLMGRVCDVLIRDRVMGSDHCPLVLLLSE